VVVAGEDAVREVRLRRGGRPSGVMKNAVEPSVPPGSVGVAVKCETRTTNRCPRRRSRAGVITSSSPSRRHCALRPSTATLPTESPAKSRSKRDSDCVARARIVTVPSSGCDGARVA
jgi:hypothetical protein